jgi:hypothetical protein
VVRPNEQPLEREVDHQAHAETDDQRRLKGHTDNSRQHGRGGNVDERYGPSDKRKANALAA